jgi:hypothetical protein
MVVSVMIVPVFVVVFRFRSLGSYGTDDVSGIG